MRSVTSIIDSGSWVAVSLSYCVHFGLTPTVELAPKKEEEEGDVIKKEKRKINASFFLGSVRQVRDWSSTRLAAIFFQIDFHAEHWHVHHFMLYVYTVDGTFKIEKENIGKKKKGNQSRNVFVAPLHRKTTAGAGQKRVRKYKEKRGASGLMANVTHISSDRLYFFLYLVHDLFANSFYHLARRFFVCLTWYHRL